MEMRTPAIPTSLAACAGPTACLGMACRPEIVLQLAQSEYLDRAVAASWSSSRLTQVPVQKRHYSHEIGKRGQPRRLALECAEDTYLSHAKDDRCGLSHHHS